MSVGFYDFGSGRGNSMIMAAKIWGGVGVGFEASEPRRNEAINRGLDCRPGNMIEVMPTIADNSARYVILNHILEHMESATIARNVVEHACRIASEFVFIAGPWFDGDGELFAGGCKMFASDWPEDHPTRVTMLDLHRAYTDSGCVKEYTIWGRGRIPDTDHPYVFSLAEDVRKLPHPYRWQPEINSDKPATHTLHGCFYELCSLVFADNIDADSRRLQFTEINKVELIRTERIKP